MKKPIIEDNDGKKLKENKREVPFEKMGKETTLKKGVAKKSKL